MMLKKIRFFLSVVFFAVIASAASEIPGSQAKWIWYPELAGNNQLRFFRYEFDLREHPSRGTLDFSGDDVYEIWINGKKIHKSSNFQCPPFQASELLRAGRNCIAVEVNNIISAGGLLMRAELFFPNHTSSTETSNSKWRCSKQAEAGWNQPGFDDSTWKQAVAVCDVTEPRTWRKRINLSRFLSKSEQEAYDNFSFTEQSSVLRIRTQTREKLEKESEPQAVQVIRKNGFPWIKTGNKEFPALLYNSFMLRPVPGEDGHLGRFKRFHEAGFRLFVCNAPLATLWREGQAMDITGLETQLIDLLGAAPEARLLVMIDLNPPEWYVKKHPEELIGYGSGAKPVFNGDHLRVPMARPSMASTVWMEECGRVVDELIHKLEKSPAGKRIIGYQAVYGIYSEWHYFGMTKELPDTGRAMTAWFREYLKNKYSTDAALRQAWGKSDVTLESAEIPVKERLERPLLSLRDPASERMTLDYLDAHAEAINHCQSFFNRMMKQASGNRALVGNYSGYFFGMGYGAEGWQTKTPEMLASNAVDFQAAPYSYAFRKSGDCGLPRNVFEAYPLRGKMSILESDARTHLSTDTNDGHSRSLAQSVGQLTRDFCNATTHGSALWYYDFDHGWYDRPEYLGLFSRLLRILEDGPDVRRCSEVALVCDFDSVPYHTNSVNPNDFSFRLLNGTARELCYSGAPFDRVLWQDLSRTDYKVYFFPNSFHATPEKLVMLEQLRAAGKVLIFLYAPGLLSDTAADVDGIAKFTGIHAGMLKASVPMTLNLNSLEHPYLEGRRSEKISFGLTAGPVLFIDDPAATVLGTITVNGAEKNALAVQKTGKSTTIYCTVPILDRVLLRNILKSAGVHLYTDGVNDVLFASRGLIGLHCSQGGRKTIQLPSASQIRQILPEERIMPAGSRIEFDAEAGSTVLFVVK